MDAFFGQLAEAGYEVRPARFEDLPQLVPMFNAAEAELSGAGDWTVERYWKEWQESGIDLEASTRHADCNGCLLYTSPSPRDRTRSRMPSSA